MRFPIGIATSMIAVALPTIAATVVWSPFDLRRDDHVWSTWSFGTMVENLASSFPWGRTGASSESTSQLV